MKDEARRWLVGEIRRRFWILALLVLVAPASARDVIGQEAALPESYRLRVENVQYGRVEISVDGGARYALIGRVMHPATETASDRVATTSGIVLRGDADGFAFATAPHQILKLRPYALAAPTYAHARKPPLLQTRPAEASGIITDLPPGKGLFGDLTPPFHSQVALQTELNPQAAFPASYAPSESDVFVLSVSLPPPAAAPNQTEAQRLDAWKAKTQARVAALAQSYASDMLFRARAAKHLIVAGTLNLRAQLPADEPDPITAVTYAIDGDVVAAQNVKPFTYAWDTRRVADGEHIVEIRALNAEGGIITRARALIVVRNGSPASPPTPTDRKSLPPPEIPPRQ